MSLNIRSRQAAPRQQLQRPRPNAYQQNGAYPTSEDESQDYPEEHEEDWAEVDEYETEDLGPSDSASATISQEELDPHNPPRRTHRLAPYNHHQQYTQPVQAHAPHTAGVDPRYEDGHYGQYPPQREAFGGRPAQHAPYMGEGRGGRGRGGQGYPQNQHVAPYMGGGYGGNQMMAYPGYGPQGGAFGQNGASFFGNDHQMYDMMPYQQQAQQQAFFNQIQPYNLPAHLQQFHLSAPVPAPTEHPGQSKTPANTEVVVAPPDPDKLRLEAEIAAFKAASEKAKQDAERKEQEVQIRKDAEAAFQRRMEDMRKAQEEANIAIEKAKVEAERAARERIEAERKAEDLRQKQHAEAMARAEENARRKFEADMKAVEERRKKEDEDRARAEENARIKLEAAIKAEAIAKAAADKKLAEEVERIKKIEEDAKRKAEADAAAKVEKDKQDAAAKAEAEAQAKKDAEDLKKRIQEEARVKYEESLKKKEKPPIRFKDAVGRKFNFPFHHCATWQGMEELIKQAFMQVDVLGPHVQSGHYDLHGPNGEIILPSVWEKVIEPDWQITMTMWPLEKSPVPAGRAGIGRAGGPNIPPGPGRAGGIPSMGRPMPGPGGVPPPPGWHGSRPRSSTLPPDVEVVTAHPHKHKSSSSKKKPATLASFFGGGGSKPTKKKKK